MTITALALPGELALPAPRHGIVVFAHGSGSGRLSPRNRQVAADLREAGFGTLLFDLLQTQEMTQRENVFDINLLSERLLLVTRWLGEHADLNRVPVGYFGASTARRRPSWRRRSRPNASAPSYRAAEDPISPVLLWSG